jgi:hypothetical protein
VKQIRQGYCQYQDQQRCCQKPRGMFTGDIHERSDNYGQKRIVPCQGETQPGYWPVTTLFEAKSMQP